MINLFSPLKSQTAVVFFQIEYCGDTFVLYSSLQCRRFIWASQPLRHLRSFIQSATFDLELESTVGGGGGERLKEYSLPHPLPSLSTPRYKFRALARQNYAFSASYLSSSFTSKLRPVFRDTIQANKLLTIGVNQQLHQLLTTYAWYSSTHWRFQAVQHF